MFQFAWPLMWLLSPLPLLYYFLLPKIEEQEAAVRVPFYSLLASYNLANLTSSKTNVLKKFLLILVWLACIGASARPQWIGEPVSLPAAGRDLLLAVDISGSMKTPDMVVDRKAYQRIDIVKLVVSDFVARRESDRLGLILFGSQAYLQAPLTFDRATIGTLLQEAQLGFAGQRTAIGDAIGLAIKRLQDRPAESRVLVLLTDGANTSGEVDPRQAADLAKLADIKVYTVGVGANEMVENSFFGKRRVNPSAELDESTLTYIAEQTGGKYFRAHNPEELVKIYQHLDELEPMEQDNEVYRPVETLYHWPLGAALLISLIIALSGIEIRSIFRLNHND